MHVTGGGKLMGNLIQKLKAPNGIGGGQEWLEAVPITGAEYHFVLVRKILKEKTLMAWVITGQSVTKILNPIMTG